MGKLPTDYEFALVFPIFRHPARDTEYSPPRTTILHIACQLCHEDLLALILSQKNVGLSIRDTCGWSPLHLAAWSGRDSAMQLLIDDGVKVNQCTRSGDGSDASCL